MKLRPHPLSRFLLRLCVLAGLAFLPFAASCFAQAVIRFVRDPDPAPSFQLKDLEGKDLNLEASKGRVVLLNFWATWCGPCREEIPGLIALQQRYKDQLQIIGLVVDEDDDKEVRKIADTEGINYPVALADSNTRIEYGGITALPTVFVINTDGRVVQKHVGLFNPALFETEVRALLGLPISARIETFQDQGDIFLKHADRAKILPGVNMSNLSEAQREAALRKFNAESCNCGCKFTLAQCRIYDPACQISQQRTAEIVKKIALPAGDASQEEVKPPPLLAAPPPSNDSAKP